MPEEMSLVLCMSEGVWVCVIFVLCVCQGMCLWGVYLGYMLYVCVRVWCFWVCMFLNVCVSDHPHKRESA